MNNKYITEPTVTFIGSTFLNMPDIEDEYLQNRTWTHAPFIDNDADLICEFAGRVCYNSFGEKQGRKDTTEYLQNILKQRHYSVLEHANFTFVITGISRSLSHELVRHRHFSFSQASQRYIEDAERSYVIPPSILALENETIRDNALTNFKSGIHDMEDSYKDLVTTVSTQFTALSKAEARKRVLEIGRSLLPNATATEIVVTGNVRAWRHFLELRGSLGAEPEIRRLAHLLLQKLQQQSVPLFGDFIIVDGEITTPYPGA